MTIVHQMATQCLVSTMNIVVVEIAIMANPEVILTVRQIVQATQA